MMKETIYNHEGTRQDPANVLERAKILQAELEIFQNHFKQDTEQTTFSTFLSNARTELSILNERAADGRLYVPGGLSGTNLIFFETVWRAAKNCRGLMGLSRRVYAHPPSGRYQNGRYIEDKERYASSVVVDVVAEDGSKWIKISTITARKLVYDMADKGLAIDDLLEMEQEEANADDDSSQLPPAEDPDDGKLNLIRMADDLKKASLATRVKYKHPSVQLILPRLQPGDNEAVDIVLRQIREKGIEVECGAELPDTSIQLALDNGLLQEQFELSSVLNIDCTILLALISDISHTSTLNEPWFRPEIQRQCEGELQHRLLPNMIYPLLGGRELVSTATAAQRMREIVSTVATQSERERAEILLNDDHGGGRRDLQAEWQNLSCHETPEGLRLPLTIVGEYDRDRNTLPAISQTVLQKLADVSTSDATVSSFMYGWATGRTTLTSNAFGLKAVNRAFNEQHPQENSEGPNIWLCPIPRSLAGKEKEKSNSLVRRQKMRLENSSLQEGL
ncbi:MAG: hypothetical protein M1820_001894 [Bogoriella megaspora]|nr:MAG: hypothetical protein M1820_001894 [Bogoriella megaspora]